MLSAAFTALTSLICANVAVARMSHMSPLQRSHSSVLSPEIPERGPSHVPSSPGCGADIGWPLYNSTINVTTTVGVHERSYLVHIPKDYDHTVAHPVVLSFHGYGKTAGHQEVASQLSEPNNTINGVPIIAAYPQGLQGIGRSGDGSDGKYSWQAAAYALPNASDIEFTHTILNDLSANLCIDTTRVYATGNSNGGGFTNKLACEPRTNVRFAAFGIASGAIYPDAEPDDDCKPQRKVPVLIAHGTDDDVVPYKGEHIDDPDWASPNIDDFATGWATRNGFGADAHQDSGMLPNTTMWVWGEDGDAGQVKRFKIEGMHHQWPSTVVSLDKRHKVAPFNLTGLELLPFFERYALPL